MTADEAVRLLGLEPHPEGGAFRETFRDPYPVTAASDEGGRGRVREASSAIYFLLREGEVSRWHRLDASEVWHHYAGAPVRLEVSPDGEEVTASLLGDDLAAGQRPQALVPAESWQRASPRGGWSLVGCTVAPAFRFDGFELAPDGWTPGQSDRSRSTE